MLLSCVLCMLPQLIFLRWPANKIRIRWHYLVIIFFTICFATRLTYYTIFNNGFDMMIINGLYDDKWAILITAIQEYQLLLKLPAAILGGIILAHPLKMWLKKKTYSGRYLMHSKAATILVIVFLAIFCVFVRYGGAFNYEKSINWESANRLKSHLLNEAVLDDGQALYRVRSYYKRLPKTDIEISPEDLRNSILSAGGNPNADGIDQAFFKQVQSKKLPGKPRMVSLIIGESFPLWPFLPEYQSLGLVDKCLKIQQSKNSIHTEAMLAHGSGTMTTVNGFITGLPAIDLHENYRQESFRSKYATGIGSIMKSLGYKTVFWYGGFDSWQNIKKFVKAQNFDEFFAAGDFKYKGGNAWGCPDKVLFQQVENYLKGCDPNEKIFNIILTTSNHPPYSIDIQAEGFDVKAVRKKLPATIAGDDKTMRELGHIWYTDQVIGDYVARSKKLYPDALYLITGDHAERFSFASEVDHITYSAVPCIIYGFGINKFLLDEPAYGCHMQIMPTLAELIGEPGTIYSSMMPSLFDLYQTNSKPVFNYKVWIDRSCNDVIKELPADNKYQLQIIAMKRIAAYRVLNGNNQN